VFVIHTILVGLGYAETKSVNLTSHGVTKHIYEYSGLPEIYAQHLGGRVLVRHIDGPDTSTSSHVKDTLWVSHYRCFMQLSVEHLKHDLVGEVHPSQINIPVEAGDISNITYRSCSVYVQQWSVEAGHERAASHTSSVGSRFLSIP
jgi:hypothetical protein